MKWMKETESKKEGNPFWLSFCTLHWSRCWRLTNNTFDWAVHCCFCLQEEGRFSSILDPSEEFSVCKKTSFLPLPSPYFFCSVPSLVIEDETLLIAREIEGRILQFIFIFMAVSVGVCLKFPEQLWDVEHNDRSFYFSSWQRSSKKTKQTTKLPNKTKIKSSPPLFCSL